MDGFDELNYDLRDEVERQLLLVQRDFPNAVVVVSSRPDQRFSTWQSYYVFDVEPLDEDQIRKLIDSFEYPLAIKKRFLKEVEGRLLKTHKSFLSSPLLASIMLLTYKEYAEIPEKMNAFYDRAFDTLFQRHDAQKDQYKRKRYTSLQREDFKSLFSTFCAMSYLDRKISFDEKDFSKFTSLAIKYNSKENPSIKKTDADKFSKDLIESVCMLKYDGLDVTFVHRSFQEYFAANFVSGLRGSKVRKFLDAYAERLNDSVIPMAAEMSRSIVEEFWIVPTLDDTIEIFDDYLRRGDWVSAFSKIYPRLYLSLDEKGVVNVTGMGLTVDYFSRSQYIDNIYRDRSGLLSDFIFLTGRVSFSDLVKDAANNKKRMELISYLNRERSGNGGGFLDEFNEEDSWWLEKFDIREKCETFLERAKILRKEIGARLKSSDKILDEFFD